MKNKSWPGWDGTLLIILALMTLFVYFSRGRLGGESDLLVVLVLDLLWLFVTALKRRSNFKPRGVMPFKPLVVIPTKNNVNTVGRVAEECLDYCEDVLVVDDGSTDGSGDSLYKLKIELLRHPKNLGKGAALDTALKYAYKRGYSHIVALDADGQHYPHELPKFLEAARKDPWAIHVGVRNMDLAPGVSQFGRNFSNFWIWADTGHKVGDSQSGYRVYPVDPILSLNLKPGRYEWEVAVLVKSLWNGIAVRDIECEVYYPPENERVSSFRPFKDNLRISLINTKLFVGRFWPTRWINRVPDPGGVWQGNHRGRAWGWLFYIYMTRILGRKPTYAAMSVMSLFYLLFSPTHKKGLLNNLKVISPEKANFGNAYRVFYNFACSIVDRFLLLEHKCVFKIERENTLPAQELLQNSGAIFLTAHMGNPDLGAAALQTEGKKRPVNVLQYTSLNDPYLKVLKRYPEAPKVISINSDSMASIEVAKVLREGEIVAIKGDRTVDERVAEVDFMGQKIEIPTGPFLLASIVKVPLVILGCFKEGDNTYRVIATIPRIYAFSSRKTRKTELNEWAQEYADVLAQWAQRYPLQWYNFHDSFKGDSHRNLD